MRLVLVLAVLSILFLFGCAAAERAKEAAITPTDLLGGKTPLQTTITNFPSALAGNIESIAQIATALGVIAAAFFGWSAVKKQTVAETVRDDQIAVLKDVLAAQEKTVSVLGNPVQAKS